MPTSESAAPRSHGALWWGLVVVVLLAGFADLWRGGISLAPVLLVLAYCVLIPIAILK
jgi:hypothetical protein